MTKRKGIPDDGIQELIEWEEHQYNKGYWINRFTPFFPPKRTKGNWILSLITLFMFVLLFIVSIFSYFQAYDLQSIAFIIVTGLFSFAAIIQVRNLKPINNRDDEFGESDAKSLHNHERKTKLPKKRKDYR